MLLTQGVVSPPTRIFPVLLLLQKWNRNNQTNQKRFIKNRHIKNVIETAIAKFSVPELLFCVPRSRPQTIILRAPFSSQNL